MLLVHTTGTTKIGDVRRYTITYSPSHDRLLPLPTALHLRIKNTNSLPFRAAYLNGPYTLYVSVCRQEFRPWPSESDTTPHDQSRALNQDGGIPIYDPQLKAGASFYATLPIPSDLIQDSLRTFRESGSSSSHARKGYEHGGKVSLDGRRHFEDTSGRRNSVTWIVEIVSQVIFSTTANVRYELLLGRDEKSLSLGSMFGSGENSPKVMNNGLVEAEGGDNGVLSGAVTVALQETKDLWDLPPFPRWEDHMLTYEEKARDPDEQDEARERRRRQRLKRKTKKVHLVILTHGLHSNTGADMLFLKESIDEEERKATALRKKQREQDIRDGKVSEDDPDPEDDVEQVIVRGFHDNFCRTERGIKYLGKRLAKYVLHLVHPTHNPPPKKSSNKLQKRKLHHHPHLTPEARVPVTQESEENLPYKITSISFIGHSLGGLVQTYAIAYIHAHSPNFFQQVKPNNFVALATPFLGLSNENPLYVRFALDFGLVGKSGQDLGLSWRAPNAFASFAGNGGAKNGPRDHSSKPLLRILPTGPAHDVLKMFKNRTVYANVVNDGIVPLRTSCLLFLDWKGLGRVEKARRENGTVGGLVEWGWGQLVTGGSGSGSRSHHSSPSTPQIPGSGFTLTSPFGATFWAKSPGPSSPGASSTVSLTLTEEAHPSSETARRLEEANPIVLAPHTSEPTAREQIERRVAASQADPLSAPSTPSVASAKAPNPFSSLLTLFRPHAGKIKPAGKIYHRSQTQSFSDIMASSASSSTATLNETEAGARLEAPPRTTLLEAAGDVLNPPLPSAEFIIDSDSRPRTIFHDRVYHGEDIPALPPNASPGVEEKIARAYHKDLSWRKVLVRLEPDAHNNMIVRRMFANAYGWPVVKHVVETHFGGSWKATTPDDEESTAEGATDITPPNGEMGVRAPMATSGVGAPRRRSETLESEESSSWTSDAFHLTDEDDEDEDEDEMEDADAVLQSFLGLPSAASRFPISGAHRPLVEVSKVNADAGAAWGGSASASPGGVVGSLGLGLRGLGLRSASQSWGSRRGSVGSITSDGRSEAVRMLERCGSHSRSASAGTLGGRSRGVAPHSRSDSAETMGAAAHSRSGSAGTLGAGGRRRRSASGGGGGGGGNSSMITGGETGRLGGADTLVG